MQPRAEKNDCSAMALGAKLRCNPVVSAAGCLYAIWEQEALEGLLPVLCAFAKMADRTTASKLNDGQIPEAALSAAAF